MRPLRFGDTVRLTADVYADGHTYLAGLECRAINALPDFGLYVLLMDTEDATAVKPDYLEYEIVEEQTK